MLQAIRDPRTFHMLPSGTYQPKISLHLCHTRILYNLDLISISFDVLSSKEKFTGVSL